ncbi:MAG: RelA/SpoT family protein, partial [Ignavibacteria bacterium]
IRGEDKPGILNDISNSITNYKSTNIKSVNIFSHDSIFEGSIAVYVSDLGHLNRLIERLKNSPGVFSVERFQP